MPMPGHRNVDRSLLYVLLAIVLIVFLRVAGSLVIEPAWNHLGGSMALREIETAFREVQHPTGSERLSMRSEVGEFTGGEQGCDFYVGEVRRYEGSEEVVLAAYAGQSVNGNPLQVLFFEGGRIPVQMSRVLPEPLNDLAGWELGTGVGGQSLYMVYLLVVDAEGDRGYDCQ